MNKTELEELIELLKGYKPEESWEVVEAKKTYGTPSIWEITVKKNDYKETKDVQDRAL